MLYCFRFFSARSVLFVLMMVQGDDDVVFKDESPVPIYISCRNVIFASDSRPSAHLEVDLVPR